MPLQKITLKPGVNRENTRYTNEGGYYESEKVRFRQGTPEKIGGWLRISANTFLGVCRSLWNWITLVGFNLIGVGTNLKFYIENGGAYFDITPIRASSTINNNPFAVVINTSTVTVTDTAHGAIANDFVTFSGATAVSGLTLNAEFQVATVIDANSYTFTVKQDTTITAANPAVFSDTMQLANGVKVTLTTTGTLPSPFNTTTTYYVVSTSAATYSLSLTSGGAAISAFGSSQSGVHTVTAQATATSAGGGGAAVVAAYQLNVGPEYAVATVGWGAGGWGLGTWGNGVAGTDAIRLWNQNNFGEDLVYGPRGGGVYYWDATAGTSTRGVNINTLGGTVTFTNSTSTGLPTVVTLTNILAENTQVQFAATTSLPTGVSASTNYYLQNVVSGVSANIALTAGGTLISTTSTGTGVYISLLVDAPTVQNNLTISDTSRFVILFGCNDIGTTSGLDPMLIRWSDQESVVNWYPSAANQAGSVRLSHGSTILTTVQTRQEIVVFTDSSVYSLQYLGPPLVWGSTLLGDNISIIGPNAAIIASGVIYWMGVDKFYTYDGRVQTLPCDLRQFIFGDINTNQGYQVTAGSNEGFSEVWWFYCSSDSVIVDRYVIYNYLEKVWYYGTMGRTAWLDSGLTAYPVGATYSNNLVFHENGVDDGITGTLAPIESYITSSQFDIGDGNNFAFVWRVIPDLTFRGSTAVSPSLTMQLQPLQNSGSGYNNPKSVGGTDTTATQTITGTPPATAIAVDEFTGQVNIRVRGRQMSIKIAASDLGVQWQMGSPRIEIRPDGRR